MLFVVCPCILLLRPKVTVFALNEQQVFIKKRYELFRFVTLCFAVIFFDYICTNTKTNRHEKSIFDFDGSSYSGCSYLFLQKGSST